MRRLSVVDVRSSAISRVVSEGRRSAALGTFSAREGPREGSGEYETRRREQAHGASPETRHLPGEQLAAETARYVWAGVMANAPAGFFSGASSAMAWPLVMSSG